MLRSQARPAGYFDEEEEERDYFDDLPDEDTWDDDDTNLTRLKPHEVKQQRERLSADDGFHLQRESKPPKAPMSKIKPPEVVKLERGSQPSFAAPRSEDGQNKAKKKNGYLMYVLHRRKEMEKDKKSANPLSLPELTKMFDADWKNLSDDEKEEWKQRAKIANGQATRGIQSSRPNPFQNSFKYFPANTFAPAQAVPPRPVEKPVVSLKPARSAEPSKRQEIYEVDVKDFMFSSTKPVELRKFAVVNVANYYLFNQQPYIPGELGISVFSLKEGIIYSDSWLVDPRMRELRNSYETIQVEKFVGLPPPMFEENLPNPLLDKMATCDYKALLSSLDKAMKQADDTDEGESFEYAKVVFAPEKHVRYVKGTIAWLIKESKIGYYRFNVLPLEGLMFEIGLRTHNRLQPFQTSHGASCVLTEDSFLIRDDLSCEWHQQKKFLDGIFPHCALFKCKNHIYLLIRVLAPYFSIQLVPGVTAPVKRTIEYLNLGCQDQLTYLDLEEILRRSTLKYISDLKGRTESMGLDFNPQDIYATPLASQQQWPPEPSPCIQEPLDEEQKKQEERTKEIVAKLQGGCRINVQRSYENYQVDYYYADAPAAPKEKKNEVPQEVEKKEVKEDNKQKKQGPYSLNLRLQRSKMNLS